jgi:nicotinate-nucleotide adenylyltransferase
MTEFSPQASALSRPIGLLGGSFDPIHVGHLQLARDARDRLGLRELRLIPAGQPWQKGPITDAAHRAAMVARAIEGEPGLVLDTYEIERAGPSYTVDTLRALRNAVGPAQPLIWVIGADQMARLDTWREWTALTDLAHIAVAQRNGAAPQLNERLAAWHRAHHAGIETVHRSPAGCVVDLPMTPVDAAATEIRALLAAPASQARDLRLSRLVPAPVLLYIRHAGLYGARP